MICFKTAAVWLAIICCGCALVPPLDDAKARPEGAVATIELYAAKDGLFKQSALYLHYLDGIEQMGWGRSAISSGRLTPGPHGLGILVNWGDFCLPLLPLSGSVCFNHCYAGIVLFAEAGRTYSYSMVRSGNQIGVAVTDEAGATAAEGKCQDIPSVRGADSSNTPLIRSIDERIEKETREMEESRRSPQS